MSLLTVIQYACRRTNVPIPTTVTGNQDPLITQMLALLEEEGRDLSSRGPWQALTNEATWTTTATEDQGALTTLASNGFDYMKNMTFWDRTNKLPIWGPLTDVEWQTRKAIVLNGPRYQYRIRAGKVLINPVPAANLTFAFEYISKNWILGADTVTYKTYFTLDTDTILLPEELVLMGLRWRWKKEKGFEYAEDFRTYEMQVQDALGRDGSKGPLSMSGDSRDRRPGIFIPDRNWSFV